jgi:hypothetical protein
VLACQTLVADESGAPSTADETASAGQTATAEQTATADRAAAAADQTAYAEAGCVTSVTVVVPRQVKRALFPTGHAAAKPEGLPVSCDWQSNPAVRTFVIEIRPPSLTTRRPTSTPAAGDEPRVRHRRPAR